MRPPPASCLAARFPNPRGITGHPDGDRSTLSLGVVAAECGPDDFDGRVCCSERIDDYAVSPQLRRSVSEGLQQIPVADVHRVSFGGYQRDFIVVVRDMLPILENRHRVGARRWK